MSKRKADQLNAESTSVGGGRGRTTGTKTPAPETSGWSGLPPELVRRVGQLHDDPKSLARMELACKSWRNVIMEGNDGVDIGETPCLWRDLAQAKFPRLTPLVEAVRARPKADPKHSWKILYRVNSEAQRISRGRVCTASYQPKTSWNDYFLTIEFRREDNVLFIASGKGDRTSPLWEQDSEVHEVRESVICKGHLDPRLSSRLGADPFDKDSLQHVTARVYITRLSDMSVVELGELFFNRDHDLGDSDGRILWGGVYHKREFLPVGTFNSSVSNKLIHAYSESMRMRLWFESWNGEVLLEFQEKDHDYAGEWDAFGIKKELAYLEMHCPWPETN